MTAPMFPALSVLLSDGREFKVQPVMIDLVRVERELGDVSQRRLEVMTRCAWHAARRSKVEIPEDFEAFAEQVLAVEEEDDGAGNPTTAIAGTG